MKRLGAVLLLAGATGCASDKRFVADATAARIYHEDRYERVCVNVKGPQTCRKMKEMLDTLKDSDALGRPIGLLPLANSVQQVGALPKQERKEIKKLMRELERLP